MDEQHTHISKVDTTTRLVVTLHSKEAHNLRLSSTKQAYLLTIPMQDNTHPPQNEILSLCCLGRCTACSTGWQPVRH
jgi:hypothetical protein